MSKVRRQKLYVNKKPLSCFCVLLNLTGGAPAAVEKIIQTPGLWEASRTGIRVAQSEAAGGGGDGACAGYCRLL